MLMQVKDVQRSAADNIAQMSQGDRNLAIYGGACAARDILVGEILTDAGLTEEQQKTLIRADIERRAHPRKAISDEAVRLGKAASKAIMAHYNKWQSAKREQATRTAELCIFADSRKDPVCNPLIDEHRLLLTQMCNLGSLVREAFPEDTGLRRVFDWVLSPPTENEDYTAPLDQLRRLRDLFDAQPLVERQRILRGWSPSAPREDTSTVTAAIERYAHAEPLPCLLMIPDSDNFNTSAAFDTTFSESISPVHVAVLQGATRDDVLKRLRCVVDFLTLYWDQAITDPEAAEVSYRQQITRDQVNTQAMLRGVFRSAEAAV